MDYIMIDDDRFENRNKVWGVIEYHTRPNSTGVHLVLEDPLTGETKSCVVASHEIEWLESKDY